ncbi:PREDICTED: F-box protein At2g35280-like [Camelina sativa]|uniref:F-box protein At2g35280-like n=1 Tax=Camelina sativa TaxID=90675 RepID=A0ABM1RS61_CAMSA|nr:PREDICTED: F-box protein At2g35280-like [Camelina sativa]
MNPLAALTKYQDLMEKCIASENVQALYIKGIQEYFHKNNTETGLKHLKKAAEGSYDNNIYLYGNVKFCRGDIAEGKFWLDKLGWKQNKQRAINAGKISRSRYIESMYKKYNATTLHREKSNQLSSAPSMTWKIDAHTSTTTNK